MADKYWVRRPFNYGDEELDRGQIIELQGARNDEKLERLGYVQKLDRNSGFRECGVCFRKFVGEAERNGHADLRHSDRYKGMTKAEREAAEEEELDRIEKRLERDAPLHFEKTKASRDAGEGTTINVRSDTSSDREKVQPQTGRVKAATKRAAKKRSTKKPGAGRAVRSAGR